MKKVSKFNLKNIYKAINSKNVISFDVFDTLIKRNCIHPKDIFKIVEQQYNKDNDEKIYNFFNNRIAAEKKAQEEYQKEEITLDEIYEKISYNEEIKNKLKEIEIKTELLFCQRNNDIYPIYKYAEQKKKKIIFITDMYLPYNIIESILKNSGYNVNNNLFISSCYCVKKSTGNLFKKVLKELKISKKEILHIGDSIRADWISPKKIGIKSIHIKRYKNNLSFLPSQKSTKKSSLTTSIMYSFINNNINQNEDNFYFRFGYEVLGPTILEFCYWIRKKTIKYNFDNLLFCARDMKVVQEIYNSYFKDNVRNSYFYVSRKSTYLPYLYKNNTYNCLINLIPKSYRKYSIQDILRLMNINDENLTENLKKYNLKLGYSYKEIVENKNFKKYYTDCIKPIIESKGKVQYYFFKNYIKKIKLSSNTALIDIGWHGMTQKMLNEIFKINVDGLYFGIEKPVSNIKYEAYLFDNFNNKYQNQIYSFKALLELMISALDGSTLGYSESGPVLGTSYNSDNIEIKKIQKGIMDFCNSFIKYSKYINECNDYFFVDILIKNCTMPTLNFANSMGEIFTDDINCSKLAKPKKIKYYLFKFNDLKKDIKQSEWKIGFLKRLIKIKLPYFKMYDIIRKKKNIRKNHEKIKYMFFSSNK